MRHTARMTLVAIASTAPLLLASCATDGADAGARGTTSSAGPASLIRQIPVEVAADLVVDGTTVTWVEATLDTSSRTNPRVVPVPGAKPETARLAEDATFFTPGPGTPEVTADGLGTEPVSRGEFETTRDAFAPKLFFNARGEVVGIATRHRP
ncbi:hypothetical protein [Saccharothrix longispora]|uniref:hypothetical protein n=1 Tax=Saccharothrix longispora TaxID=33920 RepID=UPI0028FD8A4D|nr:hypothetical protein [Saccharothrix longispora]MBY8848559.1 hypothetical protein [Saccharothrix sp. MB29]MDU0287957.1 hypothetical protein [Saccharothrix longispora]